MPRRNFEHSGFFRFRLEPLSRTNEVASGISARVHDPAWALARQWQFGEFMRPGRRIARGGADRGAQHSRLGVAACGERRPGGGRRLGAVRPDDRPARRGGRVGGRRGSRRVPAGRGRGAFRAAAARGGAVGEAAPGARRVPLRSDARRDHESGRPARAQGARRPRAGRGPDQRRAAGLGPDGRRIALARLVARRRAPGDARDGRVRSAPLRVLLGLLLRRPGPARRGVRRRRPGLVQRRRRPVGHGRGRGPRAELHPGGGPVDRALRRDTGRPLLGDGGRTDQPGRDGRVEPGHRPHCC